MSQPACHQFTMSSADWVSPTEFLNYIGSEHNLSTKCFHLNCQSVRSKHNELDVFFSSLNFQFDFIMLSETWYNRGSLVWHLPDYQCFNQCRTTSRGGGVSLLVRDSINVDYIEEFSCVTDDYEVLSFLCGRSVYSVFYRPPSGNIQSFFLFP